jgi:two-component system chemotaxis response regulator CheB
MGSSTGGPAALMQVFGVFAEAPPCAFVIAQHMPEGLAAGFAHRIDRLTTLRAREGAGGVVPSPGGILVASSGRHLCIEVGTDGPVARLENHGAGDRYAPSVDRLF